MGLSREASCGVNAVPSRRRVRKSEATMAFEVRIISQDEWWVSEAGVSVGRVRRQRSGREVVYFVQREGQAPNEAMRCASYEQAMAHLLEKSAWDDEDTIVGLPGLADEVARAVADERERQLTAIRRVRQRWAMLDLVLERLENNVLGRMA
jgi:hypothetical protein